LRRGGDKRQVSLACGGDFSVGAVAGSLQRSAARGQVLLACGELRKFLPGGAGVGQQTPALFEMPALLRNLFGIDSSQRFGGLFALGFGLAQALRGGIKAVARVVFFLALAGEGLLNGS